MKSHEFNTLLSNAEALDSDAMYQLGKFFLNDPDCKNEHLAALWMNAAAEKQNIDAISALSDFYYQGIGVKKNEEESNRLLKLANDLKAQREKERQQRLQREAEQRRVEANQKRELEAQIKAAEEKRRAEEEKRRAEEKQAAIARVKADDSGIVKGIFNNLYHANSATNGEYCIMLTPLTDSQINALYYNPYPGSPSYFSRPTSVRSSVSVPDAVDLPVDVERINLQKAEMVANMLSVATGYKFTLPSLSQLEECASYSIIQFYNEFELAEGGKGWCFGNRAITKDGLIGAVRLVCKDPKLLKEKHEQQKQKNKKFWLFWVIGMVGAALLVLLGCLL